MLSPKPLWKKLLAYIPPPTRAIIRIISYGLVGGGTAVALMQAVHGFYDYTLGALAVAGRMAFVGGSLLLMVCCTLLVGFLLTKAQNDSPGSGIPQLKAAYWNDLGYLPGRSTFIKFIANVLSLGGGVSLGQEGPAVFLSGAAASFFANRTGISKPRLRLPAIAGAAAGLAAAFNTPLAAITFVLEEIIGDLNSRFLGSVLLAAVVGAFVTHAVIGRQPAFVLPNISDPSWPVMFIVPIVATLASLGGVFFQRAVIIWRLKVKFEYGVKPWLRPLVGGLITWSIGVPVFLLTGQTGIFGVGYHDLATALSEGIPWAVATILVIGKIAATIAAYAWGGAGGIFSPTLFIGAMVGLSVAGVTTYWLPISAGETTLLACVGMCCCLGAVVRTPLTALLMIFEMTHQFSMIPALMIGTIISQAMTRLAGKHNFYETILAQDGHELSTISPPRDLETWQNQSVAVIANWKPVILTDLSVPELQKALTRYPFQIFPVELGGVYAGVALRQEMQNAVRDGHPPQLHDAATGSDTGSIRSLADQMVQSSAPIGILLDAEQCRVIGLVTLHDVLRAQIRIAE